MSELRNFIALNATKKELLAVIKETKMFVGLGFVALRTAEVETIRKVVLKEYDKTQGGIPQKIQKVETKVSNNPQKVEKMKIRTKVAKVEKVQKVAKVEKVQKVAKVEKVKTVKMAANAPQKVTKMKSTKVVNSNFDEMKFVSNAQISELETIAKWDARFKSVDFKAEHLIHAQFIQILMSGTIEDQLVEKIEDAPAKVVEFEVAANEVEAPTKPKAKRKPRVKNTVEKDALTPKAKIMLDYMLECAEAKDENDQWVSQEELVDTVSEVWGNEADERRRSTLGAGSFLTSKLGAKGVKGGWVVEKTDKLFTDENDKKVITFRVVYN